MYVIILLYFQIEFENMIHCICIIITQNIANEWSKQAFHLQSTWNDTQVNCKMVWQTCVLIILIGVIMVVCQKQQQNVFQINLFCTFWRNPVTSGWGGKLNLLHKMCNIFRMLCFEPYLEIHQPFYVLNNTVQSATLYNLCEHDIINTQRSELWR